MIWWKIAMGHSYSYNIIATILFYMDNGHHELCLLIIKIAWISFVYHNSHRGEGFSHRMIGHISYKSNITRFCRILFDYIKPVKQSECNFDIWFWVWSMNHSLQPHFPGKLSTHLQKNRKKNTFSFRKFFHCFSRLSYLSKFEKM